MFEESAGKAGKHFLLQIAGARSGKMWEDSHLVRAYCCTPFVLENAEGSKLLNFN